MCALVLTQRYMDTVEDFRKNTLMKNPLDLICCMAKPAKCNTALSNVISEIHTVDSTCF